MRNVLKKTNFKKLKFMNEGSFYKESLENLKTIKLYNILMLILAGFINSVGATLFLSESHLLDSGISGTSMLITFILEHNASPLVSAIFSMSVLLIVLNFPFFIIGVKKIGIHMLVYSLIAISCYSLGAFLLTGAGGAYTGLNELSLFKDLYQPANKFACALFGGLISGVGSGLTIKFGGAMDGIDVLSLLIHKKLGLTVGQVCMVYNAILYILFAFLNPFTDKDLNNLLVCLYSLVSYYIGLKVIDLINEGLDRSIMCFIVSDKADEVADEISKRLGRGVTYLNSTGYYSKQDSKMIYTVINRFEVNKLRLLIMDIDDAAFVTFTEVSELVGQRIKRGKRNF